MESMEFVGGGVLRIHVNINNIRHNAKAGDTLPVCRVQSGNVATYCDEVIIDGPSKLVYSPEHPLACGAKVWIETTANVKCNGVRAYNQPKGTC